LNLKKKLISNIKIVLVYRISEIENKNISRKMPSYKFNKDNRDSLKIMPQKKSNEHQQEQNSSSISKASWQVENDIYKSKDPFEFLADEKGSSIGQKEEDDPSYLNQSEKTDKEYTTDDYEEVLEEYPLNDDSSPKLIRKKPRQHLEYVQEIYLRYLRPPSPEPPGTYNL